MAELSGPGFVPMPRSGKPPEYKVIGGIVYCDGIKVLPWQLTDEECRQYLPEYYKTNRRPGKVECPWCDFIMEDKNKRSLVGHLQTVHVETWEKEKDKIMAMNAAEAFDYILDLATRKEPV